MVSILFLGRKGGEEVYVSVYVADVDMQCESQPLFLPITDLN